MQAVAQAAMVWALIDEDTSEDHIADFIETGSLEGAPDSMPYNPAVLEEIAKTWGK